jgi:hypothetical protein
MDSWFKGKKTELFFKSFVIQFKTPFCSFLKFSIFGKKKKKEIPIEGIAWHVVRHFVTRPTKYHEGKRKKVLGKVRWKQIVKLSDCENVN